MSRNLFGVLFIAILALSVVPVGAVTREEAKAQLARAFVGVQEADRSFTYVNDLVDKLNTAARLLDAGGDDNVAQASVLISEVIASTPGDVSSATQAWTRTLVIRDVLVAVLLVSAVLVWFYGSRVYWGLWLRVRGGWRVERV